MIPTYRYASSQPFERDDIELVKMFLSQFKDEDGDSYVLKARPDVEERKAKAVEAIAVAENGRSLAIEHTYIQPFEGQRSADIPFVSYEYSAYTCPPARAKTSRSISQTPFAPSFCFSFAFSTSGPA
jgi:hypothetical protein